MITRRLLLGHGAAASLLLPAASRADPSAGAHPASRAPASRAPAKPAGGMPLVMLDPGHGGKDPGAVGISGTYEKFVAFAAAEELQRQLQASGRYRVELTRGRDVFIPLEDRVGHAQTRGAALFVSMHADALYDHGVRGASVYTLGATASDAQTAALAKRENASDRFAGGTFHAASPEVERILASLVRQETRTGSARMAHSIVNELGRNLKLLQNPSRHAGFVVLKAADIPSVLVEMGFMSNREDEAALQQVVYRASVATAMRRAIDNYFAQGPSPRLDGTRMAG